MTTEAQPAGLRITITTDQGVLLDMTTCTREEFEQEIARNPNGLLAQLMIGQRVMNLTQTADSLAADLRSRTPRHDGSRCDALFPCAACATGRRVVQVARRLSEVPRVPEQRRGA